MNGELVRCFVGTRNTGYRPFVKVDLFGLRRGDDVDGSLDGTERWTDVTAAVETWGPALPGNGGSMNDERQGVCRCPTRPFFTPGSMGSGSAQETEMLRRWSLEHGSHPYAHARDELAGAIQQAESRVHSGESVLVMAADILGMPRPVLQKALDAFSGPATPQESQGPA